MTTMMDVVASVDRAWAGRVYWYAAYGRMDEIGFMGMYAVWGWNGQVCGLITIG